MIKLTKAYFSSRVKAASNCSEGRFAVTSSTAAMFVCLLVTPLTSFVSYSFNEPGSSPSKRSNAKIHGRVRSSLLAAIKMLSRKPSSFWNFTERVLVACEQALLLGLMRDLFWVEIYFSLRYRRNLTPVYWGLVPSVTQASSVCNAGDSLRRRANARNVSFRIIFTVANLHCQLSW